MPMDSLPGLFTSISHSIKVLSNEAECDQTNCYKLVAPLKRLKPFIDHIQESNLTLTESDIRSFEALDAVLSKAKKLVMRCRPKCSRIYMAICGPRFTAKFEEISLEISQVLSALPPSSLYISDQSWNLVKGCVEELQRLRYTAESSDETIAEDIENALRDLRDDSTVSPSKLKIIADKLDLISNQEILREACAVEKEKGYILTEENKQEEECVNQVIDLVAQMREYMLELKQTQSQYGPPIPPDFRCPLSLELMSDPVIIASGQTYERAYIQQWLDQGMTTCPKTRRNLNHNCLIPNYTVKALIETWCKTHNVPLPEPPKEIFHTPQKSEASQFCPNKHSDDGISVKQDADGCKLCPDSICSQQTIYGDELDAKKDSEDFFSETIQKESNLFKTVVQMTDSEQPVATARDEITTNNTSEQSQGHDQIASRSSFSSSLDCRQPATAEDVDILGGSGMIRDCLQPYHDAAGESTSSIASIDSQYSTTEIEEIGSPHNMFLPSCQSDNPSSKTASMSFPVSDIEGSGLAFEQHVKKLIENMEADSIEVQQTAVADLRLLAKSDDRNRITITNCGAIKPLVEMLHSCDLIIQENAVTALLNLSLYPNNHKEIPAAGAINSLVHVLRTGTPQARENAAATLYSISSVERNKKKIGQADALPPLVDLLVNGSARGKKDAVTAIFKLSTYHDNKAHIVRAGAVKHLIELMDPAAGMVDKIVATLANVASIREGRSAIGKEGGISHLVQAVELGSQREKENAAAALWHLCSNSNRFGTMVLQEGAIPPLVALSQSGTSRAREKARLLLNHLREQRHADAGRGGDDRHINQLHGHS